MSAAKSTIESLYRLCSLLGVSTELDIRNPLASEHPWDAPRSFITLYESFIYLFKVVVSLAEAACRPLRGMQYCVYAAYGPTIRVFIGDQSAMLMESMVGGFDWNTVYAFYELKQSIWMLYIVAGCLVFYLYLLSSACFAMGSTGSSNQGGYKGSSSRGTLPFRGGGEGWGIFCAIGRLSCSW
ncbi:hypothetical protein Bca101_067798 [Brassica carinata]